ncbi:MAG: HlyD family efflux transporter periplasmic adaptor subunit [Ferruginibacter sp.]
MTKIFTYSLLLFSFASCNSKEADPAEKVEIAVTPVTVTSISYEPMQEYVELNATSSFLQKWIVRANATGYLQSANVQLNKFVSVGQTLYTVKTKEAEIIGNSINILDSTFRFTGVNGIRANGGGFISQINHQNGDYVLDGEQLAVITDTKSFVFLLDLPYELRPYILNKRTLEMILPDGEKLTGTISGNMPTMDAGAQTQSIILKVNISHPVPENLIAKVKLIKSSKGNANSLPRAAVLCNETQDEFWVMKMTDSGTAAKVPVKKGIETDNLVEIISPVFSVNDKILVTGNYGLGDTAKVSVMSASPKAD